MSRFTGTFHSPLEFGHVVIIGGVTKRNAENFILNFHSDKTSTDIPLHINVVFGEKEVIIRNTKINGDFGTAETSVGMFTKEKNPLKSGDEFIFYLLVGLDRFHISINSVQFCDYIFRSSVKRVVQLQVLHGVDRITQFDHRRVFPFAFPIAQSRLPPHLAFSNDNPASFKEGSVIVLKGVAGGNPKGGFAVKFYIGKSDMQALNFDVRFSEKIVVRNHSVNELVALLDKDQETYGGFPFEYEKAFKMAIGFETQGFRVSINGRFFCEYPYKARLVQFSGLKIREKNDLELRVLEISHYRIEKDLHHLDVFSKLECKIF